MEASHLLPQEISVTYLLRCLPSEAPAGSSLFEPPSTPPTCLAVDVTPTPPKVLALQTVVSITLFLSRVVSSKHVPPKRRLRVNPHGAASHSSYNPFACTETTRRLCCELRGKQTRGAAFAVPLVSSPCPSPCWQNINSHTHGNLLVPADTPQLRRATEMSLLVGRSVPGRWVSGARSWAPCVRSLVS
jgi:hypothetical protein